VNRRVEYEGLRQAGWTVIIEDSLWVRLATWVHDHVVRRRNNY
jgi:hypothetical protein